MGWISRGAEWIWGKLPGKLGRRVDRSQAGKIPADIGCGTGIEQVALAEERRGIVWYGEVGDCCNQAGAVPLPDGLPEGVGEGVVRIAEDGDFAEGAELVVKCA